METDSRPNLPTGGGKKPNLVYFLAILSAWEKNSARSTAVFSPGQPSSISGRDPRSAILHGADDDPSPSDTATGHASSREP